jgi:hypothetical protein
METEKGFWSSQRNDDVLDFFTGRSLRGIRSIVTTSNRAIE